MLKFEGKLLSRMLAVGACSLCAHIALAAGPAAQSTTFATTAPAASTTPVSAVFTPNDATADGIPLASVSAPDMRQVECIAKVIRHEAANQPEMGQVAVAQVIRSRMKDGRFPTTACGVVKQRGQFFDVDAYQPARNDARWLTAVRIATATLVGQDEEVADGALFFHSAGAAMPGRVRIAKIADHTFYR